MSGLGRRVALGALGAGLAAGGARAQEAGLQPARLAGTVQFDMAPDAGGPPWRIFLYRPEGPAPEAGWPVMVLLDANAVMGIAVDALRVQAAYPTGTGIAQAVLVGIGYPTEAPYDSVRRSWDYSPPPGRSFPPHRPGGPEVRTGGAEPFLEFIETELKPRIASLAPIDPARQAFFGHSFGGLCVLHALFTRPQAFADWIAISPSIYWEDAALLATERRFAALPAAARGTPRLAMAVGEYETRLAPFQIGRPDAARRQAALETGRHLAHAQEMAARLRPLGLAVEVTELPGETHMSVLPVAINLALRFALGPR
ncbi:alpha/beta hydrolase [Falsiroseomonas tokyonensis]|uniref:Alpha/beta hydrolase n=1 Tax=Falsiroseomonas tokyonensis TaxID=430521 RepID=A0ABV7BY53_9PROT|nr:alpha/beta hydrolase-fold protein [Falsiroseomonas tokyonensis]MBU8540463.1 alpha/beta hydrolase [Falsiroseomonas tokyonensis]